MTTIEYITVLLYDSTIDKLLEYSEQKFKEVIDKPLSPKRGYRRKEKHNQSATTPSTTPNTT